MRKVTKEEILEWSGHLMRYPNYWAGCDWCPKKYECREPREFSHCVMLMAIRRLIRNSKGGKK